MCISNKDRPSITNQPSCLNRKLDQKNIYIKYIFKLLKTSEGVNWQKHFGKLFASNYIYIYIFVHIFLLLNNSIPRNIYPKEGSVYVQQYVYIIQKCS